MVDKEGAIYIPTLSISAVQVLITTPRFGWRFRTAPIITVIIQVTTLKTTHLRNHAQLIQNTKIQTCDACHGSSSGTSTLCLGRRVSLQLSTPRLFKMSAWLKLSI